MKKHLTTLICILIATAATAATDTLHYRGRLHIDADNSLLLTVMLVQQEDTVRAWLGSPDQTDQLLAATKSYITHDSISISIKSIGARLRGHFTTPAASTEAWGDTIEGKFSQGFTIRPITMERYDGTSPYRRPQTPKPPYPYHTQEVTFSSPSTAYLFHGTLSTPKEETPLRHPAVILVSGSGTQDRDETLLGHKPFAVIADALCRQGIVVLRYDDRGYGSTDTNLYAGTTADFANDARSALRLLRTLPQVDTTAIGIVGHSEGGLIAEMLAAEGSVNFAILMAAPAISGKEILESQTRYQLQQRGMGEDKIQEAIRSYQQMAQKTNSINGYWLNYFYHYNPKPLLKQMRKRQIPVLVLQGNKDCQVLPHLNLPVMKRYLKYPAAEIHLYENLNHLLQPCQTGLGNEYRVIEETISPQVLNHMTAFILRQHSNPQK